MRKLIFKRLCIVFSICFLLIGCVITPVIITPNELPKGIRGKNYYAPINVEGGSGPLSFWTRIYPENSGLEIILREIEGRVERRNYIAVTGIPKITGDIEVVIEGDMTPTYWNITPGHFKKIYIIHVADSEE
ncbi:hypothetical protein [uncultured Gilliamella sp.]|uniref:hypothetical protein n=1 Tax=uncultured Gilliamella sp. TaxID=1193505 RepID=UPI0025DEDF11|nr:hypothetical protein [uncultured Gilliamella sp.]